jgi:hypothetical protein
MTKFDVSIENGEGEPIAVIKSIPAQTKREAINKAIAKLAFTAERVKS